MLRENDYVNYSTHGICRIEGIRPVKFGGGDHENNYYILKPLDQGADCIFIPADNHQERQKPASEMDRRPQGEKGPVSGNPVQAG